LVVKLIEIVELLEDTIGIEDYKSPVDNFGEQGVRLSDTKPSMSQYVMLVVFNTAKASKRCFVPLG